MLVALKYTVFTLHFLVSLALIILVVSQTSKHEGLGSSVGGAGSTSYRGRPGMEEQLSRYTAYAATAFMFLSLLVFMLVEKFKL